MLGSDYTDVSTGTELSFNARVAANLGSAVVLVVHGRDRTPEQVRVAADSALAELQAPTTPRPSPSSPTASSPTELDATSAVARRRCRSPSRPRSPRTRCSSAPSFRALADADRARGSCSAASRGWTATASASSSPR